MPPPLAIVHYDCDLKDLYLVPDIRGNDGSSIRQNPGLGIGVKKKV